jgi:hypothetical protein
VSVAAGRWAQSRFFKAQALAFLVLCVAGTATGCSRPSQAAKPAPVGVVPVGDARGTRVLAALPLPESTARKMPPGVFYLLAGPTGGSSWASVFAVSRHGEKIVTQGESGHWIEAFAASRRGMAVSAVSGLYAALAHWTRIGPVLLHPAGKPKASINAIDMDISPDGALAYLLGGGISEIWARSSWAGRDHLVRRYPKLSGVIDPAFGPRHMLALVGPDWTNLHGRPDVVILSHDGMGPVLQTLHSGFRKVGYNVFWSPTAPALVIGSSADTFELLYLSGRRVLLPSGWRPLAWSPAGSQLVLFGHESLASWSPSAPTVVTTIGPVNRGYYITQAKWLGSSVPGLG